MKWDALKQKSKQVDEPVSLSLITISDKGIISSGLDLIEEEATDELPFKRLFKVPVAAKKSVSEDDDDLDDEDDDLDDFDDDFDDVDLDKDFEEFDMPKPKKSTGGKKSKDDDDFDIDEDFNFDDLDDFDDEDEDDF